MQAVIYGIVEGITEFLPVSSTGHLILASRIMNAGSGEFLKSFEIAIQLGAIISVVVMYRGLLFAGLGVWKRLCVAFLPTAVMGALFYRQIKKYLLGNSEVVLWALLAGGVFLVLFELFHREGPDSQEGIDSISYAQALVIGLFQTAALIPGVSRAAATIVGGLSLGLKRKTVVEFSFLLAIPTMLAATSLDLLHSAGSFSPEELVLLLAGFLVSGLVAALAIRSLLVFIKRHTFIVFGIYRVCLALAFWWLVR